MNTDDSTVPFGEPLPNEYETRSREELKLRLQEFIGYHLEADFEKLCHIIYRHDVSEEKFNEALQGDNIYEQAGKIADLVIERELQKVETRRTYRKHKEQVKRKELE